MSKFAIIANNSEENDCSSDWFSYNYPSEYLDCSTERIENIYWFIELYMIHVTMLQLHNILTVNWIFWYEMAYFFMIPISNFICHWKISHHKLWLNIVRQLDPNWYLEVAAHNLAVHNLVVHNSVVQHKVETEFHWLRTRNHHIWCRDRA